MLQKHIILGIHVHNRVKRIPNVQTVLTEFGCNIKTRIGLHDTDGSFCSPNGLILLELVGDEAQCDELARKLGAMDGVEVQKIEFDHP
jgi:hypothetical protein